MLLDFRKPPYNIEQSVVSHTGKWKLWLGNHFHANKVCWVVGATSRETGEHIVRHYNETNNPSDMIAKHQATTYWEDISVKIQKPSKGSLQQDQEDEVSYLLEWANERFGPAKG